MFSKLFQLPYSYKYVHLWWIFKKNLVILRSLALESVSISMEIKERLYGSITIYAVVECRDKRRATYPSKRKFLCKSCVKHVSQNDVRARKSKEFSEGKIILETMI